MERYLRLNIENRVLERYRKKRHIPFKPAETIPIKYIEDFEIVDQNDLITSKMVLLNFKYNNIEHSYKVSQIESEIWNIMMTKAKEWSNYYEKFPGNKGNHLYKEIIEEIWSKIDKDYEEYELFEENKF